MRAKNGVHADYGEWSDVITQETSTTLTVRLTARSTTINKGTTTLLTAIASRADNIEYVFTAPNGGTFTTFAPFLSNQRNWVAPDKSTLYQEQNGVPDAYEIIVVANDTTTSELPVRDSIQITVLNRAPVIDLFESPGLSFDISTLTPNVVTGNSELPFTIRVTDPDLVDADNLAIEWSTNGGSHVVQDAGLSCLWTLPALPATAVEYDITVTVKDGDYITDSSNNVVEAEDSKTAIIRVNAVPTVTVTASDTRVGAQDQVTITAVIDDPDDTIDDNEVYWDPSNGNFIGDQTVVSNGTYTRVWESPNANGTSTIIVEYRDIYRSPNFDIASGFVQIVVTDNSPPQLRILGDDTVATNQVLRLQAAPVEGMSTIDPDGDTLTFVWEIVSGPGRLETTDNNVLHDPRLPYDPPINPVVTEDTAIIYIPPSPPSRPDAPTVEEVVGEITSLQVTWVAPDNNGTDITDYDIRYKITGQDEDQYVGESFIGTGVTHKIENLNSQTSYDVQVRATNLAGPSDWSETGVGMTPNAPPVITSFTATPPIASINREVTLMVNATDADAKPSDLNYLFEIVNDPEDNSFGFLIDVFPSNVNIYTAPGTVGSYDVMVTVSDNADPPASVSRTLTIPVVDVPSTITTIRVRQGTTDTTIPIPRSVLDVTWTAPDDNGSTIIGYDIEYRESGLSIANTMRLTATSATLERLEPDTDYEVRVRAQNSAGVNLGNGEWSGYVTGHTADDIPDIPVITIVVPPDTTSGRLQVSWTVADDNGSAITDYNIQYRVSVPPGDPVNPWDEWRMGETITTSPEIVAGLVDTDPTTYDIQVQATNGVGTTEWSEIAVGTTRDPNQPPTIVRFTADETEIVASDVVQTTIPRFSVLTVIANDDNTARDDLIYTFTIIGDTATDDRGSFRAHPQNIHQIIYDPPKDAGVYTVSVEVSDEDIGYIQPTRSLDITVLNVPDAPPAPRLMPSTTDFREMTVTWDEPFNNFSLITDYDVQYKTSEDSDLDYTILMRSETSITRSETLAMLTPGTTYNIQVRAVNAVGEGDWSDVATDMTGRTPLRLISVTANPMTIMVGETSTITVLAEGHNLMYEYSVAEGEGTRMNAVVTNQQIYTAPDTAGTYTITVVVTDGVSFVTGMETITVTAAATVPDVILRPQVFGISNLNQNSVVFRWLEPYDGGSPITGYQVERNGSLISGIQPTTRSFTGNSVDRVRIRAVNSVGVGSFSTSFTGRSSLLSARLSYINPTLRPSGRYNANFSISYNRPYRIPNTMIWQVGIRRDGDFRISDWTWASYRIPSALANRISSFEVGEDYALIPDIPLEAGVTYELALQFYSPGDEASNWFFRTWNPLGATVPEAPDTPTVTQRVSHTELLVHWQEPDDGGSLITHYQIQYKTIQADSYTPFPNDIPQPDDTSSGISHVLPNLSVGTDYQVQVRAVNAVGESGWSEPPGEAMTSAPVTIVITAPLPPIISSITAPSAGTLRVTWIKPPVDDDTMTDDDITDYDVEYKLVAASVNDYVEVLGPNDFTDLTTDITGLMSGERYHVHVQAANSVGESGYGPAVIGTTSTDIRVPDPPENLVVNQNPDNTKLNVSWAVPNLFGGRVLDYDIQYRRTGTTAWVPWNASDTLFTNTSDEIENLTPNTGYDVQVRVQSNSQQDSGNGVGVSDWTSTVMDMTGIVVTDPIVPEPPFINDPPTDDTRSSSNDSVTIGWSTPNLNGSTLVGYLVEYRRAVDNAWRERNTIPTTNNSITIFPLLPDTRYAFRVKARGMVGTQELDSGWSNIRYVYTQVNIPPPAAPVITVTDTTTSSISISWTMPPASGGRPVTSYTVEYRVEGTVNYRSHAYFGLSRTTTIPDSAAPDLAEDTEYDIRVTAYIGSVQGEPGEITDSTDSGNSPPVIHSFTASSTQIALGANSTYIVYATDPDNDTLLYDPSVAEFNLDAVVPGDTTDYGSFEYLGENAERRRAYQFTPTLVGFYRIQISVSDGLESVTRTINLTVIQPDNNDPVITVTGPDEVVIGTTPEFEAEIDDPDSGSTWEGTWSVNRGSISPTTDSGDQDDRQTTTVYTPPSTEGADEVSFSATDDRSGTGSDSHEFQVVIAPVAPDQVDNVTVTQTIGSHTSLDVNWGVPYNGGSPITDYSILYVNVATDVALNQTVTVTDSNAGTPNNATIPNLNSGQEYEITVAARNAIGLGQPSEPVREPTSTVNTPPSVHIEINNSRVVTYTTQQISTVVIDAVATDAQDRVADLTYSWTKTGGEFQESSNDDSPSRVWVAPNIAGVHTVTVTVEDTGGLKAEAKVVITITGEAPTIISMTAGRKVCPRIGTGTGTRTEVIINVDATDPDPGDIISYEWSDLVNGVTSLGGRRLTWTAPETPGAYPITVTATADNQSTSRTETFVVNNVPTVNIAASITSVTTGGNVIIAVVIRDLDDDPTLLTHNWDAGRGSWDGDPVLITSSSTLAQYRRTWQAPSNATGDMTVGFRATDSCGSALDDVTINVVGEALTVTIEPSSSMLVLTTPVAQQEQFTARGVDSESGTITYSWDITGTALGTLDMSVGQTITYRPTAVGIDTLTVTATDTDNTNRTATASATITVTAPMTAPTIDSLTAGKTTLDPTESTVLVCETAYTTATVRWSVSGPGTLSAGEDDLSQVLTADINVRAGRAIAVSCRLTNDFGFVVETVNFTVNNVAPEITGYSGVPASITLSGSFRPVLSVTDLNGDSIRYRWSSDTFVISNSTAASPTITPDIQLGTFTLSCTVGDNPPIGHRTLEDTIDFSVRVTQTPENNPPTVTITGDTEIFDNGTSTLNADAEDLDGDNITYAWSIVSGAGRISRTTGTRTVFTPNGTGSTTIECVVTDTPGDTGSDRITIEVSQSVVLNDPPVVIILGGIIVHVLATEMLSTRVSDPNGDTISGYAWEIISGNGSLSSDNESNTDFTPDGIGSTTIECVVTDSRGATGFDRHTITARNRSPSVTIIGSTSTSLTQDITLTARGSDPDGSGDIDSYSWEKLSGNGGLSPDTGTRTVFTPDGDGDTVIRCVITDKSGATGDDTHTVSVINRDPSVTIFGESVGLVSQGIDLEARATDPDGFADIDTYAWSIPQGGGGLSSNSGDSTTYTPNSTPGLKIIQCIVTDMGGATDTDRHDITTYRLPSIDIIVSTTSIFPGDQFGITTTNVSNATDVTASVSPSTYASLLAFPARIWVASTSSSTPIGTVFTATVTAINPGGSATDTSDVTVYGRPTATLALLLISVGLGVALGYTNGDPTIDVTSISGVTTDLITDNGTVAYWEVTIASSVPSGTVITLTGAVTNPAGSASDSVSYTVP